MVNRQGENVSPSRRWYAIKQKQMRTAQKQSDWFPKVAVFFGFFIMGFVDIVGISTNFIRNDFGLSSTLSNTIPMMVFVWFALFSIPAGILMGRIGRKRTVMLALLITAAALVIPYLRYEFVTLLVAFSLLGISNTMLQVSLNPLVAAMFTHEKTASVLTSGQLIKSISSLLGPLLAGVAATVFGDWKMTFTLFSAISILSLLLLSLSAPRESGFETSESTFGSVLGLLRERYILFCFLSILLIVGLDVGINTTAPELMMKRAGLELSRAGLGSSIYFLAKIAGTFAGALLLLKSEPMRFLKRSLLTALFAFVPLLFFSGFWILVAALFLIGFMCANVFSIIFTFALQHKRDRSNEISALMIMGVSGGALLLPLQGVMNDLLGLTASLSVLYIALLLVWFLTYKMKQYAAQRS